MDKGDFYAERIIEGRLPDQETFSKEEVLVIAKMVCAWAKTQIDHELDEWALDKKGVDEMIANCEYTDINQAVFDAHQTFKDEFGQLGDFIEDHFY